MADGREGGVRGRYARGGRGNGRYRGLKSNFPATGMRGMWAELYINDPDILSDVTEIAVKKLGYWSESRSRDDQFVLFLHARSHVYTCIRIREHTHARIHVARERQGKWHRSNSAGKVGTSRPLTRFLFVLVAKLSRRRWIIRQHLIGDAQSYMIMSVGSEDYFRVLNFRNKHRHAYVPFCH